MAEVKRETEGPLGKLKEAAEDKEEQLMYLATLIRVIVLVWSAGILTLNYVKIPGYDAGEKIDPTFIVSGVHRNFSLPLASRLGVRRRKVILISSANISKKDMEFLIAKASETAPAQTIRIESGPVKIVPDK